MLFQTLQDKEWSGFLTQFGVYIVIGIFFTLATVYQLFFMQWLSLALSYSMRRASRLLEMPECELHRLIRHRLPKTPIESASHGDTLRDLYDGALAR